MYTLIPLAQAASNPEHPMVWIGFLILLALLVLILTRGAPRKPFQVVDPLPPERWTDSPVHARARGKAAAAAIATHLHTTRPPAS